MSIGSWGTRRLEMAARVNVALDVSEIDRAIAIVSALREYGVKFKAGFEFLYFILTSLMKLPYEEMLLFLDKSRILFHLLAHAGFLDVKLADIPNTVAKAVTNLGLALPYKLNVHAMGGAPMMRAAVAAADALGKTQQRPQVIAVTWLTSLTARDAESFGITLWQPSFALTQEMVDQKNIADIVVRLARLAQDCGCDGVVCSAQEARAVRDACGPDFVIISPGIRKNRSADDQRRIATPCEAIASGVTEIVVGREIIEAEDPAAALLEIVDDMLRGASTQTENSF